MFVLQVLYNLIHLCPPEKYIDSTYPIYLSWINCSRVAKTYVILSNYICRMKLIPSIPRN